MQWSQRNRSIKYILIVFAVCIAAFFLFFSHYLVKDLKEEANGKMSVWAEAMAALNKADENTDLNLVLNVINNNNSIPVIVLNEKDEIVLHRNLQLNTGSEKDSVQSLEMKKNDMLQHGYSIILNYDDGQGGDSTAYMKVLYDDSVILKQLTIYPYIQIGILLIFTLIIIFTLLSLKRAEQNRVWVGLTKETAHQLGTPISSLMAWTEILKETYPEDAIIPELDNDVKRLQLIADRFSKVGSAPELVATDVKEMICHVVDYMSRRCSKNISITYTMPEVDINAYICAPLFEWVLENICKNAMDAMEGKGSIHINLQVGTDRLIIEITDTGKGIAKNKFKTVFQPGFTTKKRGWGLGLSLSKRIIEEYHHGVIFVKSSEIGKGTTFRIELHKGWWIKNKLLTP